MNCFTLSGPSSNYTLVSNVFIDKYMLLANGEFVKVYLLLLRLLTTKSTNISASIIADQLNLTESDVKRALNYWDQQKVITIDIKNKEIVGIVMLNLDTFTKKPIPEEPMLITQSSEEKISLNVMTKPQYSNGQLLSFKEKEPYEELIMVAEKFLGNLSQPDLATLISFHDWLGLPINVIDILLDFCVSNNHRKMHYIEKVAIDWAERNIDNEAKAKTQSEVYNKNYYAIKKALGQSGLQPVEFEIKLMDKWLNTYAFSLDIVLEACNRTMQHAPAGGFKYTDSILESWSKNKVSKLTDIKELDNTHSIKQSSKNTQKPMTGNKNKFTDYNQRVYDFDRLEKKAIELRLKENNKGRY